MSMEEDSVSRSFDDEKLPRKGRNDSKYDDKLLHDDDRMKSTLDQRFSKGSSRNNDLKGDSRSKTDKSPVKKSRDTIKDKYSEKERSRDELRPSKSALEEDYDRIVKEKARDDFSHVKISDERIRDDATSDRHLKSKEERSKKTWERFNGG